MNSAIAAAASVLLGVRGNRVPGSESVEEKQNRHERPIPTRLTTSLMQAENGIL